MRDLDQLIMLSKEWALTHPELKTGFVQIFGSKIQDFFHPLFQKNNLYLQTQGYQIGDFDEGKKNSLIKQLL